MAEPTDEPVDLDLHRALDDLKTKPIDADIRILIAGDGRRVEIWRGGRELTQEDFKWAVLELWDVIDDLGHWHDFDVVALIAGENR